ncbi:uncharacterized protein EI90DRAFT_3039823 [Cantharellus anzutake]|uniref:uncharacterized protein n=1 Tax=Cantharellus anzutake TaxID=1750568 RepID=UPI001906B7E3|nr:uncharacterized protein EI90DRAFT_3039823 [Cantharellus anzutake]KAF8338956.1 hypothetical protein EI90DRAFT_3039823 [Cantharellus anzutake]
MLTIGFESYLFISGLRAKVQPRNVFDKAIWNRSMFTNFALYITIQLSWSRKLICAGPLHRIVLKVPRTKPLSDHFFVDPKEKPNNDMANMYWLADQDSETLIKRLKTARRDSVCITTALYFPNSAASNSTVHAVKIDHAFFIVAVTLNPFVKRRFLNPYIVEVVSSISTTVHWSGAVVSPIPIAK